MMTRAAMITGLLVCAYVIYLLLSAIAAMAQDTFVPAGLKSSCEFWSGETCVARREVRRVRPRIVVIPKTTYKPYRVVPEHLVPLRSREAEVRGWRREWEARDRDRHLRERFSYLRPGARCWPVKVKAYSDEKVARDGKAEAIRRWSGMVRSELGELFMDYKNASDKSENCWQSSTGERLTDKVTGGNERCMVEARPCRAERIKEPDDE